MNPGIIYTIVRKELLETLRDKRTLIAMIVIPVLLYPLLIILVVQVATVQQSKIDQATSRVAPGAGAAPEIHAWLDALEQVEVVLSGNPGRDLREGHIDAIVRAGPDALDALNADGSAEVSIEYDGTEMRSREAMERIREGLGLRAREMIEARLADKGLSPQYIRPIEIESKNIASAQKKTGSLLGRALPMMMILMLGVGAFYPAVDLTAGEKERGTFETLLSTPTSKMEIVCGKFLTIFCLSMLTGLLNLGSMTLSLVFTLSQATVEAGQGDAFNLSLLQVSPSNVALILVLLVPLALFICSVMMSIALLARDFKEAQNFVTPFFILIMLPGLFAGVPGVELTRTTMFIPIANVALLCKQLLIGQGSAEMVFGVLLCTCICATLSLVVAVWLFQREDVILSEERGLPLALGRSAFTPRSAPTFGLSLLLFGLSLLLLFYVGSWVQQRHVIIGVIATQWLLFLAPTVLILWYARIDLKQGLNLRAPAPGALFAAVLMAVSLLVLITQAAYLQNQVLPIPESVKEQMERMLSLDKNASPALLIFAIAISPAICEEVLFRGAILTGVRTRLPAWAAILVVGVLFGLMHISVYRLLLTGLTGIAITYLVVRSGSIFAGMLVHLIHNGALVLLLIDRVPEKIGAPMMRAQEEGFGPTVLISALAVLGCAVGLTEMTARGRVRSDPPTPAPLGSGA
ncbi:MAG: hypothetical protein CMJ18_26905 [Phycisphaeraceae bacterium]|nr:hypothetical protein [Phycisphaeraceae bacterium]